MTQDGGRNWIRRAEDTDRVSPFEVDLGGEGTSGLSLVARSASGLGDQPPAPGDPPQTWIEVDTTPPSVQLYPPQIGTGPHAGKVAITWRASDLHLAPARFRCSGVPTRPDRSGSRSSMAREHGPVHLDGTPQLPRQVPHSGRGGRYRGPPWRGRDRRLRRSSLTAAAHAAGSSAWTRMPVRALDRGLGRYAEARRSESVALDSAAPALTRYSDAECRRSRSFAALGPDRSLLPESPEAESVSVHRLQLPAGFLQFTLDSFSIGLGSQLLRFRLAQGLGHPQSLLFGLAFFRLGLAFFRFGLAFFRFGLSKRKKPVPEGPGRRWPYRKPLRPFGYRLLNEAASRWADCLPPMEIGRRDRLPVDPRGMVSGGSGIASLS